MEIRIFQYRVPEDSAKIRREVFCDEQGFVDEFDEFDGRSVHLVLYGDGGEAQATLRFYDEGGGSAHVGRVAVKKELRGRGLGRLLMEQALDLAKAEGFERMSVGAQENKVGFYRSCGFEVCGERYFEQGCPHMPMKREI